MTRLTKAPVLGSLFAGGWLNAMADESQQNPKWEGDPPSPSPSQGKSGQSNPRPLTLLLAEDNLPDVLLVREAIRMEKLPIEVHTASDGEQAIAFIAKAETDPNAVCPNLIMLDLNLPKADGFEVLQRIRSGERCKSVPVLIISSSDSPMDRNEAARLGADYFRKPPNYREFLKLGSVLKQFLKDKGMI